jgi:hypothetical protein
LSLKDLFSKEGRRQHALQKACAKAADKKVKSEDRRPALYTLLEEARAADGLHFEPAVLGLLRRFTYLYDTNMVNDEEEKEMVFEGLVALGTRILPQVREHLHKSSTLSWGLRLIKEICDHETTWSMVAEVMKEYEPGYERDPSRKQQLMNFLGELRLEADGQEMTEPRAVDALLPYLGDHDETVRYVTVESLFKQGDERAREPLLQLMTNPEEESGRIKHRIAEGFAEQGWLIKGFRGTVEKILPEDYFVDGKGRIKLKKARDEEAEQ